MGIMIGCAETSFSGWLLKTQIRHIGGRLEAASMYMEKSYFNIKPSGAIILR